MELLLLGAKGFDVRGCVLTTFNAAGALFFCGFESAVVLRETGLLRFEVDVFATGVLRDGVLLVVFFAALLFCAAVAPDLVALRAGALSAAKRLASGLGRAVDFAANARFLAGDVVEV